MTRWIEDVEGRESKKENEEEGEKSEEIRKRSFLKKERWEGKDLPLSYHHYVKCGKWEQKFDMASFHGYDWQ